MNVRCFFIFYFFIFQYFFYDVCACRGRSCRPETTEIVIKIKKLAKTEKIHTIKIQKRKNGGLHYLRHIVVRENYDKMYFVVSDEYNLKGLLLFELDNIDLDGNKSTNYLVYSVDNYISSKNVVGDIENIQFNAINFFVPSGKNDGKYVLGAGDDVEVMFSSLKNNKANRNLIFNDSVFAYHADEGDGKDGKGVWKKERSVDILNDLTKDNEKTITLIIKKQLLESSSKK